MDRLDITRLRVRRFYGHAHDGLSADLSPGLNVVFGPNGQGKTTLARALHGVVWPDTVRGHRPTYEAHFTVGATPWQAFLRITLPLISPTFFLVFIITLIGALKVFTPIFVLSGGGPADSTTTLILYMFKQGFQFFEFGYASAVAAVLFVLVLALTLAQWSLRRRLVFYED